MTANTNSTHRQQHSQPQHAPTQSLSSSSSRSLRDRFHDAISHMPSSASAASKPQPTPAPMSSLRSLGGLHNSGAAGLKDSWDALVKIIFAPCVNIGGVPREDIMEGVTTNSIVNTARRFRGGSVVGDGNGGWGASVPFEVSASTSLLGQSLVMSSSSQDLSLTNELRRRQEESRQEQQTTTQQQQTITSTATRHLSTPPQQQQKQQQRQQDPPGVTTTTPTTASSASPWEQRKAQSRAKLRQLGERHQLASGIPGESLADTARPITPGDEERMGCSFHHHSSSPATTSSPTSQQQPELVDFDDGISAISSHTLEEMERRRLAKENQQQQRPSSSTTVLRLHPLDFTQIIDEDCEWNSQGTTTTAATSTNVRRGHQYHHPGDCGLDVVEEVDETEVVFGTPFYEEQPTTAATMTYPSVLNRVPSTRTQQTLNTAVTEDTHEFEDMCQRHEALYWTNQEHVAHSERSSVCLRAVPDDKRKDMRQQYQDHRDRSICGSSGRMSIEERARRLRELSRSRSRSDGSGSSNKSGTSSLISGQHPHDTIPLYSFDLFPIPSWRNSGSDSKSGTPTTRSGSGSRSKKTPQGRSSGGIRQSSASQDAVSLMEGSDPFDLLECSEV